MIPLVSGGWQMMDSWRMDGSTDKGRKGEKEWKNTQPQTEALPQSLIKNLHWEEACLVLSGSEQPPAAGGSPCLFRLVKECAFSIYLYQCQTSQEPGENWAAYLNNSDNMHDRLCTVAPHLNVNWVGQWHCCSLSMFWGHGAGRHSLCPIW